MIDALLDAQGSFATLRQAFGVDDDRPWQIPIRCFLARTGGAVVLVDTGIGPPGEDPFMPDRQGALPERLANVVAPEDVDAVVLTHLHVDHVGWNMVDGAPFFPNARYVAHALDYELFTSTRGERPYVRDQLVALEATGRLELFDGASHEPLDGVVLTHVPGHTPGHCIVELADVLILGDLAVHELQLADPQLAYVGEEDPAGAARARLRLLSACADEERLVGLGHLPAGLGRVRRTRDGFAWQPLD